jgi:hypothetical protein
LELPDEEKTAIPKWVLKLPYTAFDFKCSWNSN